ncbi:MAG TPA: hypothetical protein VLL25_04505 [Acidimicrobiales bacterium]|nr:hypothetical protein [Acidimicrobiales bacterium]
MWNEIVARAIVAERVAAANKAATVRRMVSAEPTPVVSGRSARRARFRMRARPAVPADLPG